VLKTISADDKAIINVYYPCFALFIFLQKGKPGIDEEGKQSTGVLGERNR